MENDNGTLSSTPPPRSVADEEAEAAIRELRAQAPAGMRVPSRSNRPVHTYTVPEPYQAEVRMQTVGLVELTADEEMNVMSRIRGTKLADGVRAQYELAKLSLVAIDGVPVSAANETLEVAWTAMSAKARALILRAYQDLHAVPKDLEAGFLKGRTTRV